MSNAFEIKNGKYTIPHVLRNAESASFVLGVYSGYNHQNKTEDGTSYNLNTFSKFLVEFMRDYEHEFGTISFIVEPVKCVYLPKFGCPLNGEDAFKISSIYNPEYGIPEEEWFDTFLLYAYKLGQHFKQSTITIEYLTSLDINNTDCNTEPRLTQYGYMYIKPDDLIENN